MKMKKRLYIYLIVALFAISACDFNSVEHNELPNYSEQAIDGELFVKFSPEVDDILQSIKSTEEGPATRSGILSVDEILNIIGAYQLERVFPYNAQREEVTRKSELHLWYLVRFDKSHKPEDVAKKLSQLGEVSMVDYNRGLKRASTAKAIPLPVEALNRAKSAQAYASNFNEEELHNAIIYAHLHYVKVYVTINTLIFDEEFEKLDCFLKFLVAESVDAVIVQDLGVIKYIKKNK